MRCDWKLSFLAVSCLAVVGACAPDEEASGSGATDQAAIAAALKAAGGPEVVTADQFARPTFIRGTFGQVELTESPRALKAGGASAGVRRSIDGALRRIAPVFRADPDSLEVRSTRRDDLGATHVRLDQVQNGLRVVGGELVLHVDARGVAYAANGAALTDRRAPTAPVVTAQQAVQVAVGGEAGLSAYGGPELLYLLDEAKGLQLAYRVRVVGTRNQDPVEDDVFVDARSGQILTVHPQLYPALNRALYASNNSGSLPGTLRRSEGGAATGDNHLDRNYDHLGTTYDCYDSVFGRDSFNDRGAQIVSSVHYGNSYVNAFWSRTYNQFAFGDGDNVQSSPLGLALDITAHEFTHAVTQNESDLVYSNESGALNEGFSDIMAAVCETWANGNVVSGNTWMIGEDVWTPRTGGDALRYMNNPAADGSSRDYYPNRYVGAADYGGVHWNSGIPNLAFYLHATGGSHPRGLTSVNVTGVGIHRAAQTWYHAAANYFTSGTNMANARAFTIQAARDRYDATTIQSITDSWTAVGVN